MKPTDLLVWVAVLLTLPLVLIYRLTESTDQRIRRLRSTGLSQAVIATQLGVTRYRVRKALA